MQTLKKKRQPLLCWVFYLRGRKLERLPRAEIGAEVHIQGWEKG